MTRILSLTASNGQTTHPLKILCRLTGLLLVACACASPLSAAEEFAPSSYRALEKNTYSQEQLGISLSTVNQPDIATALYQDQQSDNGDTRHRVWYSDEAWITDIGTLLYRDNDHDGYFTGFSLTIDADTIDVDLDVYAAIDIKRPYAERERLHTSAIFTLYGNSVADEYRIDIELVQSYPADDYDLFIELKDAYNDQVLDSVNANDFTNLTRLPLESEDLDTHVHFPEEPDPIDVNDNIRVVEYAGGTGWILMLLLGLPLIVRQRLRRHLASENQPKFYNRSKFQQTKRFTKPGSILKQLLRTMAQTIGLEDKQGDGQLPGTTSTLPESSI